MNILEMHNIHKAFVGVPVLKGVDLTVKRGEVHALLGENGAGKSTLMNILTGVYSLDDGNVIFDGNDITNCSISESEAAGVAFVHQELNLFNDLKVYENIFFNKELVTRFGRLKKQDMIHKCEDVFEKLGVSIDPTVTVEHLSASEKQTLEIAKAIFFEAKLLILDEPTAVLTPQEANILFDMLRHMKADGKSIILITHKLEEIISIVDEVTVLRDGELIGSKLVDEHTTKEELTKMMVGRDVLFNFDKNQKAPGAVKVELKGLSASNDKGLPALTDFNLTVHEGEILGLAGVDGNGQKELCEVLTGLRKADGGQFLFKGKEMINQPPVFYINSGISHIPEDRMTTGLALNWSLKKNLIITKFHKAPFSKNGLLNQKAIDAYWDKCQKEYQIKANSGEDHARALSGGNQQKVILARELDDHPEMVIANQPTRGLDIGASEYVRQKILDARNDGAAVLLVSADLEEILQLSDRIAVIYDGKIMGILPAGTDTNTIGMLMMGHKQEEKA